MAMSVSMMDMVFGQSLGDFPNTAPCYDRALNSPDLSNLSSSPHSAFMYEHDEAQDRGKGTHKHVFMFPNPTEINDLDGELNNSFWSDGLLSETSRASLWDFSGFDDISSPLQHPEDDLTYAPTLAELNNDDSQSFDAMLSSHNACITTVVRKSQSHELNNNNRAGSPTKPPCSIAGPAADVMVTSNAVLIKQERVDPLKPLAIPAVEMSSTTLLSKGARTHRDKATKSSERLTHKTAHRHHHHHRLTKQQTRKVISRYGFDPGISDGPKKRNVEQKWQEIRSFIDGDGARVKLEETLKFYPEPHTKKLTVKIEPGLHQAYTDVRGVDYDSHDEGLGSEHEDQDEENEDLEEEDEEDENEEEDEYEEEEEEEEEDGLSEEDMHNVEYEDEDACSDISEDLGDEATAMDIQDQIPMKVKSRRSEYDDLTPNPKRLLNIGNELHKLNKIISGMTPVSALPVSARNRSRKEKNKLASRACRLKKKAQHEANKVKLFGLEKEHDRLMQVIMAIKKEILVYLEGRPKDPPSLSERLSSLIHNILGQMVANHTQEFVNSVLEKTANGKLQGGLSFLKHHN